jgi:flagellar assembly protein FliH
MQSSRDDGKKNRNAVPVQSWQPVELTPPAPKAFDLAEALQAAKAKPGSDLVTALFSPAHTASSVELSHGAFQNFDFPTISDLAPVEEAEKKVAQRFVGDAYLAWSPRELSPGLHAGEKSSPAVDVDLLATRFQMDQILASARSQANEILQNAQERAARIVADADESGRAVQEQAQKTAAETTRNAHEEGLAAANAQTSDLLHTAEAIVEEVQSWRETQFAQGEMMMLRLVIEIAQSIFGEGLPLDPDALGQAFSRAFSEAKTLGDLRIYVHPEDAAALGPHWSQMQSSLSGQRIELVSSDIIKRGGCFVEGQYGSVDARVETQLRIAKDTLMSAYSAGGATHE